jgi:hypothetical protein
MEGLTDYITRIALFIDSIFDSDEEKGLAFIRQYHPTLFPALLDDSRFNRRDEKVHWPKGIPAILSKIRHRIETVFSVLTTTFPFDNLGSRSFSGMVTRATTPVLAYTLGFFLAEILTPDVVTYQPC